MNFVEWPPVCLCGRSNDEHIDVLGAIYGGWAHIGGLMADPIWLCPPCKEAFRIGLDWSLERGGEDPSASRACAFAFQVGQYVDGTSIRTFEVDRNKYSPTFIDPDSWGRFGWGRWSNVRREHREHRSVNGDVRVSFAGQVISGYRETDLALSTIHVLYGGRSLCGGFDSRNPEAGRWVRLCAFEQSTCGACREDALLTPIGSLIERLARLGEDFDRERLDSDRDYYDAMQRIARVREGAQT